MKSGRLSFNTAIGRNSFRRCWPLWVLYFGFLLMSFTVPVAETQRRLSWQPGVDRVQELSAALLNTARDQTMAAFFVAAVAVLILFLHLYSTRGNTLMNTLPASRTEVFCTLFMTGLSPLILCQALSVLITWFLTAGTGVPARFYLQWFAVAALSMIAFYGFASFCAMLTGSMLIMPAVYAVLNLTAAGVEYCVCFLLRMLVYGYSAPKSWLIYLSPVVALGNDLTVEFPGVNALPVLNGIWLLLVYCAAGLLCAYFALLLYRHRKMEAVTDIIAIPILKPIFRICMSAGTALVLAVFVYENTNTQGTVYGHRAALVIAFLLLAGAVLGWTAAEMLIRRTVKIFPFPWKGLTAVCTLLMLGLIIAEADLTGYERRIPAEEDISSVELASYDVSELHDPANIRAFMALHERLIQEKSAQESDTFRGPWEVPATAGRVFLPDEEISSTWLELCYRLKNGKTFNRSYRYFYRAGDTADSETGAGMLLGVLNTQEAIDSRMSPTVTMDAAHFMHASIQMEGADATRTEKQLNYEEFTDLWNSGLLPDAAEKKICLYTLENTETNLEEQTNVSVYVLFGPDPTTVGSKNAYWNHTFRVFTFSEHTLGWIADNTDLQWTTLKDAYYSTPEA